MVYNVVIVIMIVASVALVAWASAKMWNERPVKKGPTIFPEEKK